AGGRGAAQHSAHADLSLAQGRGAGAPGVKLPPLWDPALDALAPETRAFNAKLPKEGTPARWTPEAIAKARDLSQVMGGVFATRKLAGFEDRSIAGPAGPIRLRVFVPPQVRAVYLDIHGGGFFMGAPEMSDA